MYAVCVNSGDLFKGVKKIIFFSVITFVHCCCRDADGAVLKSQQHTVHSNSQRAYHYSSPGYHGNQLFSSCKRLVGALREGGIAPVAVSPTLLGERSPLCNFCITLPLRITDDSSLISFSELCNLSILKLSMIRSKILDD